MKPPFLLLLLLASTPIFATDGGDDFHICYFSLNHEKEFHEMDKFAQKLNTISSRKIVVKEFLTAEENRPEQAFNKMIESGTKCDGLVISGHHTGAWGGKRANGSLSIDFLEKLACDSKAMKWFQDIHALWLQGCRTLGVGTIQNDDANLDMFSADFHTDRVAEVLGADHLEQGIAELNAEFTSTLDQDNPLSSRYLRVFPSAKVFGWTRTAPGAKAQSEYSIPFHMAHIASLMAEDKAFPQDPRAENLSPSELQKYLDAMMVALSDFNKDSHSCEMLAVDAWKSHGQAFGKKPLSFENPDLNAFAKLYSSEQDFLLELRKLECQLKSAKTKEEATTALQTLLSDKKLLHYGFNTIWGALKNSSPEIKMVIREQLKESSLLNEFLLQKMESKQVGILQKIDYYAFYKDVNGKGSEKVEEAIHSGAMKIFNTKLNGANDYNLIDYKHTLMSALTKNSLMNEKKLREIMQLENTDDTNLNLVLSGVVYLNETQEKNINTGQLLSEVLQHERLGDRALYSVVSISINPELEVTDRKKVFNVALAKLLEKDAATWSEFNADSLNAISDRLESKNDLVSVFSTEERLEIAEKIAPVLIKNKSPDGLANLAFFHMNREDISAEQLVEKIDLFLTPLAKDEETMGISTALNTINESTQGKNVPVPGMQVFIDHMLDHWPEYKQSVYNALLIIRFSPKPIAGSDKILRKIMARDPSEIEDDVYNLAATLVSTETEIPNRFDLIETFLESEHADPDSVVSMTATLSEYSEFYGVRKYPLSKKENAAFVKMVLDSKKFGTKENLQKNISTIVTLLGSESADPVESEKLLLRMAQLNDPDITDSIFYRIDWLALKDRSQFTSDVWHINPELNFGMMAHAVYNNKSIWADPDAFMKKLLSSPAITTDNRANIKQQLHESNYLTPEQEKRVIAILNTLESQP